ncbi:unnamed protein product [Rotaria sordida]|uniref:Uncharacterized protein n=1 Tax=Rotaria sordida TaxID=392033 RepID=A0A816CHM3_9BILA|nr:unnamed protein product [Rotaria sordida]CAF1622851.1 unnamed protein product [Rotaria sordida]
MPPCPRCGRTDKVYYWPAYIDNHHRLKADMAASATAAAARLRAADNAGATTARAAAAATGIQLPDFTTLRDPNAPAAAAVAALASIAAAVRAPHSSEGDYADYAPGRDRLGYIGSRSKFCFFRPFGSNSDFICEYKH